MQRIWLDWQSSPLVRAADWLIDRFSSDLTGVVIALPGARSGRILAELLARRAGPRLRPPQVITAGALSDELLEVEGTAAVRLVRTLAWERSLRALAPRDLARIVSRPPADDDRAGWATLAEEARRLFGEVAAEGLDFAGVAASPLLEPLAGERARWQALARAQQAMSAALSEAGLHDPHLGRLAAIDAGAVRRLGRVVLIGVVEMNQLLRRSLALCDAQQTALVFAPEAEAAGFDELGCLIPARWVERETSLALEHWHVVDRPADQARQAARILAGWGSAVRAEQVTLGLADAAVSPYLKRRLASAGLRARDAAGLPVSRTSPARLLTAVAGWLRTGSFPAFAALVRHPEFEAALRRAEPACEPLEVLDEYHGKHLPWRAQGDWSAQAGDARDQRLRQRMEAVWRAACEVLGELRDTHRTDLAEQTRALRGFLAGVFGARELDPLDPADRVLIASLRSLSGGLEQLANLPPNLTPEGSLADAIELLLRLVCTPTNDLPPAGARAGEPTIELLGWLELPLDDAPALIVTGFEDGRVPESVRGDAYLPNRLRKDLGLVDNEQRLARDLYATELLVHSRERVAFISGRRGIDGDPQLPSRVVFHCSSEQVAPRVRRFLAGATGTARRIDPDTAMARELPRGAPAESPTEGPQEISVSAFKAYLEAPYGYYLRHVLKLGTLDDRARELDGGEFGTLAHEVLQRFGQDADARELYDAGRIEQFLGTTLRAVGTELFGRRPLPAVQLQLEQLGLRLKRFAAEQARRRADGWRIHAVEWAPEGGAVELEVDGQAIRLKGRIDRIDRHDARDEWAIWDYKTNEKVSKPLGAHRKRDGTWRDLQLPLYCLLAAELLGDQPPAELGYIAIGSDLEHSSFIPQADWRRPKDEFDEPEDALQGAFEAAHDVVRRIRRGEFFDAEGWQPYGEIFKALGGVGWVAAASSDEDEETSE